VSLVVGPAKLAGLVHLHL